MKIKKALTLLLLLLLTSVSSFAQIIEKSYLSTDRDIYAPNDTIWIKAYVFDDQNLISDQSIAMHVVLLNEHGDRVTYKKWPIENGIAEGSFISPTIEGRYFLSGVSGQMIGAEPEFTFQKEIFIRKSFADAITIRNTQFETYAGSENEMNVVLETTRSDKEKYDNAPIEYYLWSNNEIVIEGEVETDAEGVANIELNDLDLDNQQYDLFLEAPAENNAEGGSLNIPIQKRVRKIDLQFLPEGGQLVHNIESNLAFKALNQYGQPVEVKGVILDQDQNIVAQWESFYKGMGSTKIKPLEDKVYYSKITEPAGIDSLYKLPEVRQSGVALSVLREANNTLFVQVKSSENLWGENHKLVFKRQSKVIREIPITAKSREIVQFPLAGLQAGIVNIQLLDELSNPKAERLYFRNSSQVLNINISTNKPEYKARERVQTKIKVTDASGTPVKGEFTLSAYDKTRNGLKHQASHNLVSYLLLSSELKGNVPTPNFYFTKHEKARKALDLVMLTNGWRTYRPSTLSDPESFSGMLVQRNSRRKKIQNTELTLATLDALDSYPIIVGDSARFKVPSSFLKSKGDSFLLMSSAQDKLLNPNIKVNSQREKNFEKHAETLAGHLAKTHPGRDLKIFESDYKLEIDRFRNQTILSSFTITERNFFGNACDALALDTEGNWVTKTAEQLDMSKPDLEILLKQVSDKIRGFGPISTRRKHMDPFIARLIPSNRAFVWEGWADGALLSFYTEDFVWRIPAGSPFSAGKLGMILEWPVPFDIYINCEYVQPNPNRQRIYPFEYYENRGLETIDWSNVESISVNAPSTAGRTPGMTEGQEWLFGQLDVQPRPIVVIKTKEGEIKRKPRYNPYYFITTYETSEQEFYKPNYTILEETDLLIPDLRETIHWESRIVTDENGEATITWYNADRPNEIEIKVEGLDIYSRVGFANTQYKIVKEEEK